MKMFACDVGINFNRQSLEDIVSDAKPEGAEAAELVRQEREFIPHLCEDTLTEAASAGLWLGNLNAGEVTQLLKTRGEILSLPGMEWVVVCPSGSFVKWVLFEDGDVCATETGVATPDQVKLAKKRLNQIWFEQNW